MDLKLKSSLKVSSKFKDSKTDVPHYNQLLQMLEEDFTQPDDRRKSVLEEVLPKNVFFKVKRQFLLLEPRDPFNLEENSETILAKSSATQNFSTMKQPSFSDLSVEKDDEEKSEEKKQMMAVKSLPLTTSSSSFDFSPLICKPRLAKITEQKKPVDKELIEIETNQEEVQKQESLLKRAATEKIMEPRNSSGITLVDNKSSSFDSDLVRMLDFKTKRKTTPYYNFFQRSEKAAAVWRNIKISTEKQLTVDEIADIKAEEIANNFVNWVREVDLDKTLTTEIILKIFNPSTFNINNIFTKQEELFAIPGQIGDHLGMIKRTRQRIIIDQVLKDKRTFERPLKSNVAFGKNVPYELYVGKSYNTEHKKWLSTNIPHNLNTMRTAFSGITDLEITKHFSKYLSKKPYIIPPSYLVHKGMIKHTSSLRQSVISSKKARKGRENIYTVYEAFKVDQIQQISVPKYIRMEDKQL